MRAGSHSLALSTPSLRVPEGRAREAATRCAPPHPRRLQGPISERGDAAGATLGRGRGGGASLLSLLLSPHCPLSFPFGAVVGGAVSSTDLGYLFVYLVLRPP